ncbi:MAG TPA: site-2 protease family protein [Verrucomicrobiae bacterium]|jgi:Zn-dependent protease|nr:site-2 protease family protein [Verrucomicrobiae bacterium]
MHPTNVVDGLIFYIGLVVLLTFHEFAHAWVAYLCGDDTARLRGRMSLNPIVHIDPIGTVLFPLLMIFSPVGGWLIGWAKPVPVNPTNLRNPVRDDILIALAGPAMNLVLAVVLVGLARIVSIFAPWDTTAVILNIAALSLLLCFFNLIPIPPLDGSHVLRNFIGMSWETYWHLCRYGIIGVWLVLRIPFVSHVLNEVTYRALGFLTTCFGFPPLM